MKKIRIFLLLAVITLLISSCEKNFDPKIYGALLSTNFPKTESDYEAYLMTCYLPFQGTWRYYLSLSSGEYGLYIVQGSFKIFDATSDYTAPAILKAGSLGGNYREMTQGNYNNCIFYPRVLGGDNTPDIGKIRDITRFTEIIGTIEDATILSDAKKKNFLGEARLLRGLMMCYLLHAYGPVPVILDPALVGNLEAEQNLVRPTLTEMTEWITADLEFAIANMATTAVVGRYTANYARFCLMRHYLNEGSYMPGYYDKSIELYNQLKNSGYSLFTAGGVNAYADQFKIANKFNKEVIMAVSTSSTATGGNTTGNFHPIDKYCVPSDASKYVDVANTIPTPFVNLGGGWGQAFNVSPLYYDTYESGDTRKNVILTSYVKSDAARTLITRADIGTGWSGFIINKYPVPADIVNGYRANDIPLARWADVLLMYAEAIARKTQAVPTGEALQGVNDVRSRAGLGPLSGAAIASYDGFMGALLEERGHEFLYEGFRKIDLIRFNKYRHNLTAIKGIAPTHQYIPLPDFIVQQAASYGKTLEQYYERPGYASDL